MLKMWKKTCQNSKPDKRQPDGNSCDKTVVNTDKEPSNTTSITVKPIHSGGTLQSPTGPDGAHTVPSSTTHYEDLDRPAKRRKIMKTDAMLSVSSVNEMNYTRMFSI